MVWPMLVLAFHLISQELGLYATLRWLDTPMHFLGGLAISYSSYYLFAHLETKNELKAVPSVKMFLAIAITALAAVLWEFSEYASDSLLGTLMQPSIIDTLKDLMMGLLGAAVVAFYKKFKNK